MNQQESIAKVFMSGRSQAVRLPKEFRFDTDRVYIKKNNNLIILSAKPMDRRWEWQNFFKQYGPVSDFNLDRPDNSIGQQRNLFL